MNLLETNSLKFDQVVLLRFSARSISCHSWWSSHILLYSICCILKKMHIPYCPQLSISMDFYEGTIQYRIPVCLCLVLLYIKAIVLRLCFTIYRKSLLSTYLNLAELLFRFVRYLIVRLGVNYQVVIAKVLLYFIWKYFLVIRVVDYNFEGWQIIWFKSTFKYTIHICITG